MKSRSIWYLLFLSLILLAAVLHATDNTATMGSYAEDFPSLRIHRSLNAYDDKGDLISGVDFWARNAASLAAGAAHEHPNGTMMYDSLKIGASQAGRTIITKPYTDFHFYVECGDGQNEDTMGFNAFVYNYWKMCDSLGFTWEDQFFHLADDSDSVVYILRTTSCAEAADGDRKWGNASLSNSEKRQSQFGVYSGADDENYPGTDAYYMNYTDTVNYALWKAYAYKRLWENHSKFFGFDSAFDGFTYDNSHPESWRSPNYIDDDNEIDWWSFGGNTGGQVWSEGALDIDWVGWDEPFVKYGTSYNDLDKCFAAGFNIMLDTMKDMGMARSCNFVDGSPSDVDKYAARHGEAVTTLFFEYRGVDMLTKDYSTITAATGPSAELSRVDSAIVNGIPHVNEFRSYGSMTDNTGDPFYAQAFLCAHLTYQDTALTYFCFQNWNNGTGNDGDTLYLANWDMFKRYYGNVLNERQYVDTGTTVDADPVHLFWREYDSAYVFWFPPDNLADDTSWSNYYTWDCGEAVYSLDSMKADGSIDSTYHSDGIIYIPPRHGIVAWKTEGGAESPMQINQSEKIMRISP